MKLFKKVKKFMAIFLAMIIVIFCVAVTCENTYAAEPKLILEGYTVDKKTVYTGSDFNLKLTYKNTATKKIKNLKLTITSENGELLADGTAGISYQDVIEAGALWETDFDMVAVSGLEEKSYKLMLKAEYEDVNGVSYTMEDAIYIPVFCNQKLSVTDISSDEVNLGDEIEITAKVNNLGDGLLYNVTAKVEGKSVEAATCYLGNIEVGKSVNVDIISKSTHLDSGSGLNNIIITYEDKLGNEYSYKDKISLVVKKSDFSNLEQIKKTEVGNTLDSTVIILSLTGVAVIIILIVFIIKYRKKKKLLEDF